jgi:uncharacterized damage-inducible protein DinB
MIMSDKTFEQLLRYNNWANDALFKVFDGYGAQIAMEMRRAGLEPINTDYIVFLRALGLP